MSEKDRYYGCYECASKEGEGCIIFQIGIDPFPVVCPCGYGYPKFILITDSVIKMLKNQTQEDHGMKRFSHGH